MIKLIPKKRYIITWQDTMSDSGWFNKADVIKSSQMKCIETVGYFIAKKNGFLILARDYHKLNINEEYGDPTFIPLGCIKDIKKN